MNIEERIGKYLNEKKDYVRKGIFTQEGRKIDGARSGRMFLSVIDSEDFVEHLTWKQYKKIDVEDNLNDYIEKEFIGSLLSQIKAFRVKVDFNGFCRGNERTFEEKVDWLLQNGAKYTKKGIKA